MVLEINEDKSRHTVIGKKRRALKHGCKFEKTLRSIYLGSLVNNTGGTTEGMKRRILLVN